MINLNNCVENNKKQLERILNLSFDSMSKAILIRKTLNLGDKEFKSCLETLIPGFSDDFYGNLVEAEKLMEYSWRKDENGNFNLNPSERYDLMVKNHSRGILFPVDYITLVSVMNESY